MIIGVSLFGIGLLSAAYLIYRYARYSDWRQTSIGRAFMLMKTVLFAIFLYALVARWLPHEARRVAIMILIGYADIALLYQISVIVRLQGGWRRAARRRETEPAH